MTPIQLLQNMADLLAGPVPAASPALTITKYYSCAQQVYTGLSFNFLPENTSQLEFAEIVKSYLEDFISDVRSTLVVANNAGYILPNDPFVDILNFNSNRKIFAPLVVFTDVSSALSDAVLKFVAILQGVKDGTISFDRGTDYTHQIASFEISVSGRVPPSGDGLADILGYQPDADFVKRQNVLASLAKLDFKLRIPQLMFVSRQRDAANAFSTVICWKKMGDASGFKIHRREIFGASSVDFMSDDDSLQTVTQQILADKNISQVLGMYDTVTADDVFCYRDDSVTTDCLYAYSVSAYQKKSSAPLNIFGVTSSVLKASTDQIAAIQSDISSQLQPGANQDSISPYPSIAKIISGDESYGWILAGCNFSARLKADAPVTDLRAASYIGAQSTQVIADISSGRFQIPQDISQVKANVTDSLSSFGVSQTLLYILDNIGATLYLSGKDDPENFQATGLQVSSATGDLASILASIDPTTYIVDPQTLLTNLTAAGSGNTASRPVEILVAASVAQPKTLVEVIGSDPIDLTTYDGIDRFVRAIRYFYDFSTRA